MGALYTTTVTTHAHSTSTISEQNHNRHSNVFVIGQSAHNELGFKYNKYENNLSMLDCCSSRNTYIENVISGRMFTIYSDNNRNHFAIGHNNFGQCAVGQTDTSKNHTLIQHFQQQNIKILKICTNITTQSVFWICDDGKIYGTGCNAKGQLGIIDITEYSPDLPYHIKDLDGKNVMDIQCADRYSISIEAPNNIIVNRFCINEIKNIPTDIIKIILQFYEEHHNVYITGADAYGNNGWRILKATNGKNIKEIKCGKYHSLFLESNDNLWSYGSNQSDQLGADEADIKKQQMTYQTSLYIFATNFIKQKIKIKSIACGYYHNLAIDYDNKVYSWGYNKDGQCGNNSVVNVKIPKRIKLLERYDIKRIECGAYHSYVMTYDQKHFLFGSNKYNECIAFNGKEKVTQPHCIDAVIESETKGRKIKRVSLGVRNTKIIMYFK